MIRQVVLEDFAVDGGRADGGNVVGACLWVGVCSS